MPALPVDQDGKGQILELAQQRAAQQRRVVERDEQRSRTELLPAVPAIAHLHEVRTADQSTGVAQERNQHRAAGEVVERRDLAVEVGQAQLRCGLADVRSCGHVDLRWWEAVWGSGHALVCLARSSPGHNGFGAGLLPSVRLVGTCPSTGRGPAVAPSVARTSDEEACVHVLVIGATGGTGNALVRDLRRRGHAVRAMIRDPRQADALVGLGATPVEGDLEHELAGVVDGVDAVAFCAGSGSTTGPDATLRIDLHGAVRVIDNCVPRLKESGEIPREDVAAVMATCLEDDRSIGATFELLSGEPPVADAVAALGGEH